MKRRRLHRRYGHASGGTLSKSDIADLFERVREADRANQRAELKLAYPGRTKKTHSELWKSAQVALERLKRADEKAREAQAAYLAQHGREWWAS